MKFVIVDRVLVCLTIAIVVGTRGSFFFVNGETPCPPTLAVTLPDDEIERFENGSIVHEGLAYPAGSHWSDGRRTYGCVCMVQTNCVRKCCPHGEVLSDGERPVCSRLNDSARIVELAPESDQLDDELKNISSVNDRFALVPGMGCHTPNSVSIRLQPENFAEDRFVVQSNGTLLVNAEVLPQWRYCMDWNADVKKITVIVCHELPPEPIEVHDAIYRISVVISIPFLLATLIVYAIIPELKNLYGMTLMCYVGCLIAAYCFLAGGRLVYHGQPLCAAIGESHRRSFWFRRFRGFPKGRRSSGRGFPCL